MFKRLPRILTTQTGTRKNTLLQFLLQSAGVPETEPPSHGNDLVEAGISIVRAGRENHEAHCAGSSTEVRFNPSPKLLQRCCRPSILAARYMQSEDPSLPNVAIAVRTLLVGGYDLDSGGERQPAHIEIRCQKPSVFGVQVQFLIAITEALEFSPEQMHDIEGLAIRENRKPVFVGRNSTDAQLGWQEFLLILGGEVPSWRAVAATYSSALSTASTNNRPAGTSGEAVANF
jgi:hypothetical protein